MQNIKKYKDVHKDCVFVCVGSGPSLKKTDLSKTKDKIVIATNHTYKLFNKNSAYSIMTDHIRVKQLREKIIKYGNKLFLARNNNCLKDEYYSDPATLINVLRKNNESIGFSWDLNNGIYIGYSVIFSAIQLAVYMGAKKVHLIGVDQDYSQKQKFFDEDITRASTPKINDYKLNSKMFNICNNELTKKGIEFVNSTIGGKIDCIKREAL